jgi:hypothetical protein
LTSRSAAARGVERRRVPHRVEVREDLAGGLVGQLGADVGQSMELMPTSA